MAQFFADRVAIGSHRAKTPEGYLLCLGIPFARTGFQIYRAEEIGLKGDREVKVYRRFDEVFNPATLASFEGKTVTSPHPPVFLNPDNDATYYKGHIQNIRQGDKLTDGEFPLLGDILIKDSRLISQVESGSLKELSAGYQCEYEQDEHSPDTYYQVGIRGNHVAVVPSGRAGGAVKILDAKEEAVGAEPTTVVDDKVSVGALTGLLRLLGLGHQPTVDSESEAVTRNEKVAEKSKERSEAMAKDDDAKKRSRDDDDKKAKDRHTRDDDDKKTKDDDDEEEGKKEVTMDARSLTRLVTAVVDAVMKHKDDDDDDDDKKKTKDDKKAKDKKHSKDKDEAEEELEQEEKGTEDDGELISTAEVGKEGQPKNPIPGADAALAGHMALKSRIADSGTREEKEAWNKTYRILKGARDAGSSSGYADLVRASKPESTKRAEELTRAGVRTADATGADDFVAVAEHFRGKNPQDAAATLAESRKKGGQ